MLSAAFATGLPGYGPAPESLYIGLDSRDVLETSHTLLSLSGFEANHHRIPISTTDGFGVKPTSFFQLLTQVEFQATSDIPTMRNAFLTTAAEGIEGKLIVSTPLKHPRELFEGDSLIVQILLDLHRLQK